jgi:hypothetical protein
VRDQAQPDDADRRPAYRRRGGIAQNAYGIGRLAAQTDGGRYGEPADREINRALRDEASSGQSVGPGLRPRNQLTERSDQELGLFMNGVVTSAALWARDGSPADARSKKLTP